MEKITVHISGAVLFLNCCKESKRYWIYFNFDFKKMKEPEYYVFVVFVLNINILLHLYCFQYILQFFGYQWRYFAIYVRRWVGEKVPDFEVKYIYIYIYKKSGCVWVRHSFTFSRICVNFWQVVRKAVNAVMKL